MNINQNIEEIYILLFFFSCLWEEVSSNRNASRDEHVKGGNESVGSGDESIKPVEKTLQLCYNL